MNWLMTESASTYGPRIDQLYYVILAITGIIFVGVQAVLVYFLIRYRHRAGHKAVYHHGNTRVEIIWTVIPSLILAALAFQSGRIWREVRYPDQFPHNAFEIGVQARQFEWIPTYPGPDGRLGTADDITTTQNRLIVPVGRPVVVHLSAEDVIHSFFIPDFRVKQDAVPGMHIPVWFEATRTGEFPLGCAELCGMGHYRMGGTVIVQSADEFDRWHREQGAVALAQ